MANEKIPYKIYLTEEEMPQSWYNLRADMKNKPAPLLDPNTHAQLSEEELSKVFCEELVKQEMVIYSMAEKEGITVTDEEYETYLQTLLTSAGFENEDAFKTYTGMTLDEYAEMYKLDRDLLLTKELDTIYDRLVEKQ